MNVSWIDKNIYYVIVYVYGKYVKYKYQLVLGSFIFNCNMINFNMNN